MPDERNDVVMLTDDEMEAVTRAAQPLPPEARGAFLEQVARALEGQPIGAGVVHRVLRDLQPFYTASPDRRRMQLRRD